MIQQAAKKMYLQIVENLNIPSSTVHDITKKGQKSVFNVRYLRILWQYCVEQQAWFCHGNLVVQREAAICEHDPETRDSNLNFFIYKAYLAFVASVKLTL